MENNLDAFYYKGVWLVAIDQDHRYVGLDTSGRPSSYIKLHIGVGEVFTKYILNEKGYVNNELYMTTNANVYYTHYDIPPKVSYTTIKQLPPFLKSNMGFEYSIINKELDILQLLNINRKQFIQHLIEEKDYPVTLDEEEDIENIYIDHILFQKHIEESIQKNIFVFNDEGYIPPSMYRNQYIDKTRDCIYLYVKKKLYNIIYTENSDTIMLYMKDIIERTYKPNVDIECDFDIDDRLLFLHTNIIHIIIKLNFVISREVGTEYIYSPHFDFNIEKIDIKDTINNTFKDVKNLSRTICFVDPTISELEKCIPNTITIDVAKNTLTLKTHKDINLNEIYIDHYSDVKDLFSDLNIWINTKTYNYVINMTYEELIKDIKD